MDSQKKDKLISLTKEIATLCGLIYDTDNHKYSDYWASKSKNISYSLTNDYRKILAEHQDINPGWIPKIYLTISLISKKIIKNDYDTLIGLCADQHTDLSKIIQSKNDDDWVIKSTLGWFYFNKTTFLLDTFEKSENYGLLKSMFYNNIKISQQEAVHMASHIIFNWTNNPVKKIELLTYLSHEYKYNLKSLIYSICDEIHNTRKYKKSRVMYRPESFSKNILNLIKHDVISINDEYWHNNLKIVNTLFKEKLAFIDNTSKTTLYNIINNTNLWNKTCGIAKSYEKAVAQISKQLEIPYENIQFLIDSSELRANYEKNKISHDLVNKPKNDTEDLAPNMPTITTKRRKI